MHGITAAINSAADGPSDSAAKAADLSKVAKELLLDQMKREALGEQATLG